MQKPKKPIAQIPKNEKIVGIGGNELLNPESRAKKTKSKKPKEGFNPHSLNILKNGSN
ncbi:MAG TPA: hypothetical protein PKC41_09140 [Chitinophagaceae bacterium]|jgi:hypothetical protein|nr:hypothetical protein [Chitinophagaceae bacterium]